MDPFTFKQNACMICHDKNRHPKLDKLELIKRELGNLQLKPAQKYHAVFRWFINSRCHFGMPCHHLDNNDSYAKAIAKEIEPFIISLCRSTNEKAYRRIYNLMRGDFPDICYLMEREHHKFLNSK